jgi:2-succinyl-5-enolpyruvyl-6-hydroxy-3-cyclohexene-1-carboxylate synthase
MTEPPASQDVQAAFAAVLVDEWARAGVSDVVACPGSRSTPLLVAVADAAERGRLRLHVVVDERSAGFFALGLGLATGRPAPVVTTSGTAAAELHPAVLEAHHAGVPLLAVTADRPQEMHDVGAPQTARQAGLYGSSVRWEANPGAPELASAGTWRSLASRSVAEATGGAGRPGPVHLNLAFREPLLGLPGADLGLDDPLVVGGRSGQAPWHRRRQPELLMPSAEVVEFLAGAGERGLIVAGAGAGSSEALWALARAVGWPVLAEPRSRSRLPGSVAALDALLRAPLVAGWRPEVVLRLGAPWASRSVSEWLARLDCPQVLVDRWGTWAAPERRPHEVVVADPDALCLAVAGAVGGRVGAAVGTGGAAGSARPQSEWAERWKLAEAVAQEAIDVAMADETGLTEPAIARRLVAWLPGDATLFVSSSMPVRDVECWAQPREGLKVLSNRGVNGIDGVLSSALGVAAASRTGGVTALVGDLAFLYDASVLAVAARDGLDLTVVVVDNDGGGIFSFLPQAKQPPPRFERLWGTPHGRDLLAVARAYGATAEAFTDLPALHTALSARLEPERAAPSGPRVLVARTDRQANVASHERLYSAVASAVAEAFGV